MAEGWTGPGDIRQRIRKDWDRGPLAAMVLVQALGVEPPPGLRIGSIPWALGLKGPDNTELGDKFGAAREWIASLTGLEGPDTYTLEWRQISHRQLGANQVPVGVVFSDQDRLLAFAGLAKAGRRLADLGTRVCSRFPALVPWCLENPGALEDHEGEWDQLLAVLDWFVAHPRPACYLRQVDAPGVHSKFIESRRHILSALLDRVLPATAVDPEATGLTGFNRRYGLKDKPELVRYRFLDEDLVPMMWGQKSKGGFGLDADDFARLQPPASLRRVFITENETNFLAFPPCQASLVIFGAGYGFTALEKASWLRDRDLWYWGDLDTHGFAILDQLRHHLSEVRSFLMDHETLALHRPHWTREPKPVIRDLTRLQGPEKEVYRGLCDDRWAPSLRLEQERIAYSWVVQHLA